MCGGFVGKIGHQLTGKKIAATARSANKLASKTIGDAFAAPVTWTADALHKANIINDKDWQNNRNLANIMGQTVGNALTGPLGIATGGGLGKFTHNPSSFFVDDEMKKTSAYRNIARPVAKTAANLAIGYATGGAAGLISAGVSGAMGNHGSLSRDTFNPVTNVVAPALSGYAAGASDSGAAFNAAIDSGAGYGAAGSAALSAGTDGALGATYNSAVETGIGAVGEQATTAGLQSMGAQVATDFGTGVAQAAPTAIETAAPTLLDTIGGYASTAGDYIGKGAKVAQNAQQVYGLYNDVNSMINPPAPMPDQQQPSIPATPNAYQSPSYTVDDLVQLNSLAAASGGYGSAMQQERDKIRQSLGVA